MTIAFFRAANGDLAGSFLCNNYKQALELLSTEALVAEQMASEGIQDGLVFEAWLGEERTYLQGLKREPPVETLEMEYYKKLVKLADEE